MGKATLHVGAQPSACSPPFRAELFSDSLSGIYGPSPPAVQVCTRVGSPWKDRERRQLEGGLRRWGLRPPSDRGGRKGAGELRALHVLPGQ